jgi:hypothetical protein
MFLPPDVGWGKRLAVTWPSVAIPATFSLKGLYRARAAKAPRAAGRKRAENNRFDFAFGAT